MKNRIRSLLICISIVILAFVYAHVDKNYYLYDRKQSNAEYISSGILKENDKISQQFVVKSKKLNGIKIQGLVSGNVDKVSVLYCLSESDTKSTIVEGVIDGNEFDSGKFYQINIPEISDAKNKKYTLTIYEKGSDDINGISFNYAPIELNKDSILLVKGEQTKGVLVMKVFDSGFDLETFIMFIVFFAYIIGFFKVLYKLFK